MIDKSNTEISVNKQCEILDLQKSSFYYKKKERFSSEKTLIKKCISDIYEDLPFYGYRRVHKELQEMDIEIGKDRVQKYRNELNLKTIYPRKKTTIPNKQHKKYPYLLKGLEINRPNQVWAADITYLKMPRGYCYLVAIIDWYSRKILSYNISNTMEKEFCIDALKEAITRYGKPEIFNTDQGSQFTSNEFTSVLKNKNIQISMDSVGRWADNVIIERFFRTLKYENYHIFKYKDMVELKVGINKYINFYNNKRFHSALNYSTPSNYYINYLAIAA